jgi:hypothetical protein
MPIKKLAGKLKLSDALRNKIALGIPVTNHFTIPAPQQQQKQTVLVRRLFSYSGAPETFTVPTGTTEISVEMWGAGGGDGKWNSGRRGGNGGFARGDISVSSGETLTFVVGGGGKTSSAADGDGGLGGYPGGGTGTKGDSSGGGGGGYSGIFLDNIAFENALMIAGGGGGGSGYRAGGHCRGNYGDNGEGTGGAGATQSGGGLGSSSPPGGKNGSALQGGDGAGNRTSGTDDGGGGGGGYYGGGGGSNDAGGGGGGAGYLHPTRIVSNGALTTGIFVDGLLRTMTAKSYTSSDVALGGDVGEDGRDGFIYVEYLAYEDTQGLPTITISGNPASYTGIPGDSVTVSAAATSNGTLTYQWVSNVAGSYQNVANATNNDYSFILEAKHAGQYYVEIWSRLGNIIVKKTSSTANILLNSGYMPVLSNLKSWLKADAGVSVDGFGRVTSWEDQAAYRTWNAGGFNATTNMYDNPFLKSNVGIGNELPTVAITRGMTWQAGGSNSTNARRPKLSAPSFLNPSDAVEVFMVIKSGPHEINKQGTWGRINIAGSDSSYAKYGVYRQYPWENVVAGAIEEGLGESINTAILDRTIVSADSLKYGIYNISLSTPSQKNGSIREIYLNGNDGSGLPLKRSTVFPLAYNPSSPNDYYLFHDGNIDNPSFQGEIGEIIIFDRELNALERWYMNDYLKYRWNINDMNADASNPKPVVIASEKQTVSGDTTAIVACATGNGDLSYEWKDTNGNVISGATDAILSAASLGVTSIPSGNYTVKVRDTVSPSSFTDIIHVVTIS